MIVYKIAEMKEDIAWNEYEKYLGQCIERGGEWYNCLPHSYMNRDSDRDFCALDSCAC